MTLNNLPNPASTSITSLCSCVPFGARFYIDNMPTWNTREVDAFGVAKFGGGPEQVSTGELTFDDVEQWGCCLQSERLEDVFKAWTWERMTRCKKVPVEGCQWSDANQHLIFIPAHQTFYSHSTQFFDMTGPTRVDTAKSHHCSLETTVHSSETWPTSWLPFFVTSPLAKVKKVRMEDIEKRGVELIELKVFCVIC
jgi:hypothetical protein